MRDGIPMLSRNREFYYGEIPREDMRTILDRAPSVGLESAVIDHADSTASTAFYRYAYSPRRGAGKFLLGHFGTGTALDFGCGLGAITSALAQNFAQVYATDLTWERAAFTRCRTQQLGFQNVSVFCSGDTPHIPLPPASVDAVIINGVLEWLPQFLPGDPRQIQLAFLREVRTVLKPDGCLLLGIENRIAYQYFLGGREEHTWLRGVSLLPRPLANVYSGLMRGKPYRNYTYTKGGHRALFREAGFERCEFFGYSPDYLIPRCAFRLSDPEMIDHSLRKDRLRKRIRNILVRRLLPSMAPSFGVLGTNGRVTPFLDSFIAHISETSFAGNPVQLLRYQVTDTGKVNLTITSGQRQYVVKLPLDQGSLARTRDEVKHLESIAASRFSRIALAPHVVDKGYFSGQYFAIENYLGDQTGTDVPPKLQTRALLLAGQYAVELARNTAVRRSTWRDTLSTHLLPNAQELETRYRERFGERNEVIRFSELVARLIEPDDATGAFECVSHGDFWLSNVIVDDRATRFLGVIDWNQFSACSLPLLDVFHLLVKYRQGKEGSTLGDAIVGLHRDIVLRSPSADLVSQYAREFSIPLPTVTNLLVGYWLRQSKNMLRGRALLAGAVLRQSILAPFEEFSKFAQGLREHTGVAPA